MKTISKILLFALCLNFFSCSDDDTPSCVPTIWYADVDNDTLGDPDVSLEACEQPEGFVANNNDSDDTDPLNLDPVVEATVTNLYAPQTGGMGQPIGGEFTKFDFTTGQITTSTTDWDIAFRGTTIIFNGGLETGSADEPVRNGNSGAYIENGTLANVSGVVEASFFQDNVGALAIATGSGNGWYTYDPSTHLISPTSNKIIVVKTRDGKYAKLQILSYYKDMDTTLESRYYSFDYVYQPNFDIITF